MKLIFLFAALAWGQEPEPSKVVITPEVVTAQHQQITDLRAEVQRLTTLLNFYRQQYFVLQDKMIEQQIAPVKPPRVEPPAKPQGEK